MARDARAPRASVIDQAAADGIPRRQSDASGERRPHHKAKRSGRRNSPKIEWDKTKKGAGERPIGNYVRFISEGGIYCKVVDRATRWTIDNR